MKMSKETPPPPIPPFVHCFYMFATIFVSLNKLKKKRINPQGTSAIELVEGSKTKVMSSQQGAKIGRVQPSS